MSARPDQILLALYENLRVWAEANGGAVGLTQNPYDLFEQLQTRGPAAWRAIVHWEGDGQADERVVRGAVVMHRIRLVVDGTLAPTAIPRIKLLEASDTRVAFLALLGQIATRMRSYKFADWLTAPYDRFVYLGTDDKVPLPDGLFVAAYNMVFGLYADGPQAGADIALSVA